MTTVPGTGRDRWTLVSVHVPKTAGTSFRLELQRAFGDGLRLDNADRPLAHPRWQRRADALRQACLHAGRGLPEACIHGHFLPLKYALARRVRFAVWLRDPVQRVISRYHHYLRHGRDERHHERFGLVPGLTLEQFVRLPQYQDTCAEYLWGFPLERFDFVGIVERYHSDVVRFAECFDLQLEPSTQRANYNPERDGSRYEVEPGLERLIRRCNPRDVALYERACRR
ncbi:sulfotransferase family 2 domain-containing protein [Pseudoxanthomonas suwonensis]|jgi:Sulfotransferase family.|uniref:sulfotransferase family 2 domain-containing protein n=1 Tax=Pseudoxanthomonas suwonensis TaxID=314722 RepID=UPI0004645020|nr:sulfotransferase family 2 domain-containing protein [Pseudoxanthomonas suwonensis]